MESGSLCQKKSGYLTRKLHKFAERKELGWKIFIYVALYSNIKFPLIDEIWSSVLVQF